MKTYLQKVPVYTSKTRYIKGLGEINLNNVSVDESLISMCIPIQIENESIKGYVNQAYKQFITDYPDVKRPYCCEMSLMIDFDYPQTKYEIFVSFADDDTQECETFAIISKYGVDISTNIKSFLNEILLEQLSKMIFNK